MGETRPERSMTDKNLGSFNQEDGERSETCPTRVTGLTGGRGGRTGSDRFRMNGKFRRDTIWKGARDRRKTGVGLVNQNVNRQMEMYRGRG